MTDGCLKVRGDAEVVCSKPQTRWAHVGRPREGVALTQPSTQSTDHQQHIPSLPKNPISYNSLVSLLCCMAALSPVKRWSLWAVLRKLSDATFYLICWNVASHVDEVHIFSQMFRRWGWGRVSADIIVSTTQDKRLWMCLKYSLSFTDRHQHWSASFQSSVPQTDERGKHLHICHSLSHKKGELAVVHQSGAQRSRSSGSKVYVGKREMFEIQGCGDAGSVCRDKEVWAREGEKSNAHAHATL